MLWTSLLSFFFFSFSFSSFLTGKVAAQGLCSSETGMVQGGNNNYVIDFFSDLYLFPYAIGHCTALGWPSNFAYFIFTCEQDDNDMWWITKTGYTTSDCSDGGDLDDTWGQDSAAEGEYGYFKCDGDNTYTELILSANPGCTDPITVAGGLDGCAGNSNVDHKFYCDSTGAALKEYTGEYNNGTFEMCDDTYLYCDEWSITRTCDYTGILHLTIYGYMTECVTQITPSPTASPITAKPTTAKPTTATPTKKPTTVSPTTSPTTPSPTTSDDGDEDDDDDDSASSASSQFTLLAIVVSLIMSLFY